MSPADAVKATDDARVMVSGGTLAGCGEPQRGVNQKVATALLLNDRAHGRMDSGHIQCFANSDDAAVQLTDDATFDLYGGTASVWRDCCGRNDTHIPLHASGNSRVGIYGGVLSVETIPGDSAFAAKTPRLRASESATITIHGSNFNFPLHTPILLDEGNITGTLADGSEFDWVFLRSDQAAIILVPEPSALGLALLGGGLLVACRRGAHR